MIPTTLLDSVVLGAISPVFLDGSPVHDVGMMVPRAEQLDSDSFVVAPTTMTPDEGDGSLEAVEQTVLALMAADPDAVDGWTMTEAQGTSFDSPKVYRDFITHGFGSDLQVVVMAEHQQGQKRPYVCPQFSLGLAVTNPHSGACFSSALRLSRPVHGEGWVSRKTYYTWEEPVTDAMLAGAGVLHDSKPMTAAVLYSLFGPWEDREERCKSRAPTPPVAAVLQPLMDRDRLVDPLRAWMRRDQVERQFRLGKPWWVTSPEGLVFHRERAGREDYGEIAGVLAASFLYDGGDYYGMLYRDGPNDPPITKIRIELRGDVRELRSRRSIREAAAARFPNLVAAVLQRATGSADPGPGAGLASAP